MAQRAGVSSLRAPVSLLNLRRREALDGYLAIVTDAVVAHGGMVDKLIGDGMFALFNVPVDLPEHTRRAVACAKAIIAKTEEYRTIPLAQKLALGRTRVGIEFDSIWQRKGGLRPPLSDRFR